MTDKKLRIWKKVVENDLDYIANELKTVLDGPAVIILSGPVGAGKTTFTKSFVGKEATSPSYSLINETNEVAHADFYRIEKAEEVVHLEIPLYLEGKEYFIVEWGRPYVKEIRKEVEDNFSFYELNISINEIQSENSASEAPTRNFTLFQINED